MKLGILVSMINNFGEKGFYNSQEVGLAKEMVKMGYDVTIYKLLPKTDSLPKNEINHRVSIEYSGVRHLGVNGIVNTRILNRELDALLYFSDTQLSVPTVSKWCKKNNVVFIPYIGVTESHSTSAVVKKIINMLYYRNLKVYKQQKCMAKNTIVMDGLQNQGVRNVELAPVGIDLDLVNKNFEIVDSADLKMKYGFDVNDRIILFIGRLEKEKHPIELISYYYEIRKKDSRYKLCIVGKGSLKSTLMDKVQSSGLSDSVTYFERIPNDNIWELYRMSTCFVNLNREEIFGMVLLEAMYYKTKVVAWHAPGPDYVIENGKTGYLVSSESEFINAVIEDSLDIGDEAHKRVVDKLTWGCAARTLDLIISG